MPYKDAERQRKYQRERTRRIRAEWLSKHGPCVVCGSRVNLEVDHIDPESKICHRIWSWSKERREAELAKCQVLCRRHHFAKTSKENSTPLVHGTNAGYSKGCRCYGCRAAHATKKREWLVNRFVA